MNHIEILEWISQQGSCVDQDCFECKECPFYKKINQFCKISHLMSSPKDVISESIKRLRKFKIKEIMK